MRADGTRQHRRSSDGVLSNIVSLWALKLIIIIIIIIIHQASFQILCAPSFNPVPLNPAEESDQETIQQLRGVLGDFFAERFIPDSQWALGVLAGQEI